MVKASAQSVLNMVVVMKSLSAHEVRVPYMVGVYLGINAFSDAYLIVDGPDCLFFKTEYVFGTQDLHSTLLDVRGRHRIAHTLADTINIVVDREAQISDLIRRIATTPGCGMVLVTAMPLASITGSQYDRLGREVSESTKTPIVEVPARSLQGDWLDGYARVLEAVARGIELPDVATDPNKVAVVGHLLDRTESDQLANVKALTQLIEDGLGAKATAVWPSNRKVNELADVAEAGTILALPYGLRAGRVLARRTGAKLVNVPLPLGAKATRTFLQTAGQAIGREDRAVAYADSEERRFLSSTTPIKKAMTGRKIALITDPHQAPGFVDLVDHLGATAVAVLVTEHPGKPVGDVPGAEAFVQGLQADLCIATTRGTDVAVRLGMPFLEFGFPSYGTHALTETAFLGYDGAINLATAMVNRISLFRDLRDIGGIDLDDIRSGYVFRLESGSPLRHE